MIFLTLSSDIETNKKYASDIHDVALKNEMVTLFPKLRVY